MVYMKMGCATYNWHVPVSCSLVCAAVGNWHGRRLRGTLGSKEIRFKAGQAYVLMIHV